MTPRQRKGVLEQVWHHKHATSVEICEDAPSTAQSNENGKGYIEIPEYTEIPEHTGNYRNTLSFSYYYCSLL